MHTTPTGNIPKALSWGHLAITDKMLVPEGVRYRGVPLYLYPSTVLYVATDMHAIFKSSKSFVLVFNSGIPLQWEASYSVALDSYM